MMQHMKRTQAAAPPARTTFSLFITVVNNVSLCCPAAVKGGGGGDSDNEDLVCTAISSALIVDVPGTREVFAISAIPLLSSVTDEITEVSVPCGTTIWYLISVVTSGACDFTSVILNAARPPAPVGAASLILATRVFENSAVSVIAFAILEALAGFDVLTV